jgi:hypothetical protein
MDINGITGGSLYRISEPIWGLFPVLSRLDSASLRHHQETGAVPAKREGENAAHVDVQVCDRHDRQCSPF